MSEHLKILEELHDRMLKVGLIAEHGKFNDRTGAVFTPDGQEVVTVIAALEGTLGPLTPKQIVVLWKYLVEVANQRKKANE